MVCITYVISCYFGSNTSSCIVLHNLQSYCFVLHHLASSRIILHPLASYCIILHRLASPCIVLHGLTSSCIVLHCLAASCIILHCLTFSYTILQHLALSCIITIWRSSSNLTADASSTHGIRHTATTKQQSSYNIAPCDKHATFVTILVCPTGPALEVPRHPAIERAALQPQTTSCPVHGQHSEPVPFCEAPLQKFLPGHPGAIQPLVTALLRSSCNRSSTASDDADDAVACSIRTDIPFSKWNSDHKTSTNVTGAWLQPNILHSEIPRHAYLFACFQNNAMTCLISKQIWTVQNWTVQWFPYHFLSTAHAFQWKHHIFFLCYTSHRSTAS